MRPAAAAACPAVPGPARAPAMRRCCACQTKPNRHPRALRAARPQVNELQHKMSRFHGLTAANPERKQIAQSVRDGCDSLKWQVRARTRAARGAAAARAAGRWASASWGARSPAHRAWRRRGRAAPEGPSGGGRQTHGPPWRARSCSPARARQRDRRAVAGERLVPRPCDAALACAGASSAHWQRADASASKATRKWEGGKGA